MFKRTNFLYRLNSTAKVGWSSSITFATVGTALSTLVIVPGLSVLFSVLLGRDLSAPDPVRIACASALASVVLGVAAGVVARAATDRWLGVFEQVCTARRFDAAYWLGVSAMPVLLALITGITNLGVAAAYAGFGGSLEGSLSMLVRSVTLLPLALMAGICLGVFAAGPGRAGKTLKANLASISGSVTQINNYDRQIIDGPKRQSIQLSFDAQGAARYTVAPNSVSGLSFAGTTR